MLAIFKRNKPCTVGGGTVNHSVKICVECGSTAVLIDSFEMQYKDCNSWFRVKKDDATNERGASN
ncbi:hypothetical protein [Nitrosopumilus sp.]|uniref:hypothetical protein n=1 Tax=Nitrosopumilus sp. TaxID=2024843 RepID=UPI00292D11F8|nr:hypothetical protein [Nitrosopumilus sp.]